MRVGALWLLWLVVLSGCVSQTAVVAPTVEFNVADAGGPVVSHPHVPTLRLPAGVRPTAYRIHAWIDPKAPTFTATTEIDVTLDALTDRIWLNQHRVEIKHATIRAGSEMSFEARAVPEVDQFVALELPRAVGPGVVTLVLETVASISAKEGAGVFQGEGAVFTQFEPYAARTAFALFDEPNFKVPFQLTLTVPRELEALSNMPIERETVEGAQKTVQFRETSPLPSYLLAFAVGAFDFVDLGKLGRNQIPARVVVPKGQSARAGWPVKSTAQVIDKLEAWFDSPFPYPKLDLVAVTSPAFGGAMENPGLITYGQSVLLSTPGNESASRERYFWATHIHELAHQWFGNLVTAAWWDDVWLNESFADYLALVLLEELKPDWEVGLDRVEERLNALNNDTQASTRKVREPITSHDDIANAFDSITYEKGSSVLFMVEQWLGRDVFRKGVLHYLKQHAWKNASQQDFFAAMNEISGSDVSVLFSTFLDQSGFPLITGALACEGGTARVTLSQERYMAEGVTLPAQSWKVPVCMRWDGGSQCAVLEGHQSVITLMSATCPSWLLLNNGMVGYYRSRPVTAELVANVALTAGERWGVHSDLSALVERGDVSIRESLHALQLTSSPGDRVMADEAISTLGSIHDLVPPTSRPALQRFTRRLLTTQWKRVGLTPRPGEDEDARMLRPGLLRTLALVGGDAELVKASTALLRKWLVDRRAVDADVIAAVVGAAAPSADAKLYELVVAALKSEKDRRQRGLMYGFLGRTTDPKLVERSLAMVLAEGADVRETVRIADTMALHAETRDRAFRWAKEHYDALAKALPEDWEAGLITLGTGFCSAERRAEVFEFFEPRTTKAVGGPREFKLALEGYDACVRWREKQIPEAVKFLEAAK